MLGTFFKYLISMILAAFVGFTGVHYSMFGMLPWSKDSVVSLSVSIRGTQNQAVPNAHLYLYGPNKLYLGKSDANGNFEGKTRIKKGSVAAIEAIGPTYKLRKDLPIPHRPNYRAFIRLDPQEANIGHMTLISKTAEDLKRDLNNKSTASTTPPTATTETATNTTASSTVSKTSVVEPTGVKVELSEERTQTEHQAELTLEKVKKAVNEKEEELQAKGIVVVRLRPLVVEESYFEVLGINKQGEAVASALMKCSLFNTPVVENSIAALTRVYNIPPSHTKLRVYTSTPERARAYVNGVALTRKTENQYAEFNLIELKSKSERIAIAATVDDRPLIRKIALQAALPELVEWHMPEPALSRR